MLLSWKRIIKETGNFYVKIESSKFSPLLPCLCAVGTADDSCDNALFVPIPSGHQLFTSRLNTPNCIFYVSRVSSFSLLLKFFNTRTITFRVDKLDFVAWWYRVGKCLIWFSQMKNITIEIKQKFMVKKLRFCINQ